MNEVVLPECLRWSADPTEKVNQTRALPVKLFPQLCQVLNSPDPPAPAVILAAWNERSKLPAQGNDSVTDETLSSWISAYEIAWHWRQTSATEADLASKPYVNPCAKLIASRAKRYSVPIATVDGHSSGRIQTLWIDIVDHEQGLIFLHPQFEWTRKDFDADFLGGIETAWRLADEDSRSGVSAFWHVSEADGSPIISKQQNGTSGSGASFRAFWHLQRDLRLDEDVFVLASCASGDGRIQGVGELGAKLMAVQKHRDSLKQEIPATIVIGATAAKRTPQDETAIARARTWAEVLEVETLEALTAVRSVTVQAARDYLSYLADHWDKTPWYRNGKPVRFSEVHITPFVWKPKPGHSLLLDAASPDGRTEERDWRPAGYDVSVADREAGPRLERTRIQERVPWRDTFCNNEAITVITGGPGSGKTSILQWTARIIALRGLADLEKRTADPDDIDWPVQTDLDDWVSSTGQPVETLERTVIEGLALIETWGAHRLNALRQFMRRRLIQSKANTLLALDALDQVAESRVTLLGERLQAIASPSRPEWPNEPDSKSKPCSEKLAKEIMSRGTRILISTRESGLRTHHQAMSFASKSTLQAAALSAEEARELAAKWLGADQAARLEAHLRANPSLSIVADSPLLLTLSCLVQSEQPECEFPETPAALYQEIMRLLAKGAWRSRTARSAPLPDADELLDSLPPVAWQLFSRDAGTNRFDRGTMLDAIIRATGRSPAEATKLLTDLVYLGFLESSVRQNGKEHFHFRHATFREFLAAAHVAARINRDGWAAAEVESWHPSAGWQKMKAGQLLDMQAFEPAWEPLIIFVAGLMKDPLPLIEVLGDRRRDDVFRHRLQLLCTCYGSLGLAAQQFLHGAMKKVFADIMRIAKRSTREPGKTFVGSRLALWWDWVKPLLRSPLAVDELIDGLLLLHGHFSTKGWSTGAEWKVIELLKENLMQGRVSAGVVDKIAALIDRDAKGWGHDAALLAWHLAGTDQRTKLQAGFHTRLLAESVEIHARVGLSAALALSDDHDCAREAVGRLITFSALPGSSSGGESDDTAAALLHGRFPAEEATNALASLLDGEFAPIVAPVLIAHLLHPNSKHRHSVCWQIIEKADAVPANKWLDCLLAVVLSIEFEHGDDIRRWAAEVMAERSDPHLSDLGLNTLLNIAEKKKSHGWAYAARWLVENAVDPYHGRAKDILLSEATNLDSHQRIIAVAELLDMGAISPLGEPIQDAVHQAVLDELQEHHEKHGTRLHVSVPSFSDTEVDKILFEENPAAVIKALHTFNGPKMYHRKGRRMEDMEKDRHRKGRLLVGTRFWSGMLAGAIERLKTGTDANGRDVENGDLGLALFGAPGSDLVSILQHEFLTTKGHERGWRLRELLWELEQRGWRLRLRGRKIEVLRRGQEEPRADADFGY